MSQLYVCLILYCVLYFCILSQSSSVLVGISGNDILEWLQSQSCEVAAAQNNIKSFLYSKKIPVGTQPRSLVRSNATIHTLRVALSSEDSDYECRISLGKAGTGKKVVAPCGCTGSQEWVQFSELNRMRRRDPSQWVVCQTCQQRFDYGSLQQYGGLPGNLISSVLDHRAVLRSASAVTLLTTLVLSSGLTRRFLTSQLLWKQYPRWSRVVHLPLVLLFWGARILLHYALTAYLEAERVLLGHLTELETALIEPNLPVTVA